MSRLPHVPPERIEGSDWHDTTCSCRHLRGATACVQPIATLPYEALRRAWSCWTNMLWRFKPVLQCGHDVPDIASEEG